MDIKDCTAIVTGGASGMGAATAKLLSEAGAKVAIFDLNSHSAKELASEIHGIAITCDVTNEKSVEAAMKEVSSRLGTARICINCAGIARARRMVNKEGVMPLDEFREVIEINLMGTFNVMRLAAAAMQSLEVQKPTAERGIIINTASIAAYEGQIGQTAYSASKGGIVSMTLPAARELAQWGIRVVTIAPGLVETPMFADIPEAARASLAKDIPFPHRLARPEEFGKLVLHIIDNAMINGAVIRIDGALRLPPK